MFKVPEEFRIISSGKLYSNSTFGNNGAFLIVSQRPFLFCVASDGAGWEHVSITVRGPHLKQLPRCPTWEEMSLIKDLFWSDDSAVFQFHPPKDQYVNYEQFCLHLWKPIGESIILPPSILVGPK